MSSGPRVVLDTNVVLSALVFASGSSSEIRYAWQAGRLIPLVSRATTQELLRVLAYPKFSLSETEQQNLLAEYLPWCEVIEVSPPLPPIPECRDPFDRPFLYLATIARSDCLVTGDPHLLELEGKIHCPIISTGAFVLSLEQNPPRRR